MTTIGTVNTRARLQLIDEDKVHWTDSELFEWSSEGKLEIVKKFPDANTKTVEHQLVAGAKQTNPSDCIEIGDIRQNKSGNAITTFDRATLDRFCPNWMTSPTSSTVKQWADDAQPDTFYVYPPQNSSPAKVIITYSAVPTAVTSLSDPIGIRDVYLTNLTNYVLAKAFAKESENQNLEKAAGYLKLALG
jgi:hypothetical protein